MNILSLLFTKIHGDRRLTSHNRSKVSTKVEINKVTETKFSLGTTEQLGIRFEFKIGVFYEPDIGSILIEGQVLGADTDEVIKNVVDEWKDKKTIDEKYSVSLINRILNDTYVQTLILSKELGLPAPVKLPQAVAKKQ